MTCKSLVSHPLAVERYKAHINHHAADALLSHPRCWHLRRHVRHGTAARHKHARPAAAGCPPAEFRPVAKAAPHAQTTLRAAALRLVAALERVARLRAPRLHGHRLPLLRRNPHLQPRHVRKACGTEWLAMRRARGGGCQARAPRRGFHAVCRGAVVFSRALSLSWAAWTSGSDGPAAATLTTHPPCPPAPSSSTGSPPGAGGPTGWAPTTAARTPPHPSRPGTASKAQPHRPASCLVDVIVSDLSAPHRPACARAGTWRAHPPPPDLLAPPALRGRTESPAAVLCRRALPPCAPHTRRGSPCTTRTSAWP